RRSSVEQLRSIAPLLSNSGVVGRARGPRHSWGSHRKSPRLSFLRRLPRFLSFPDCGQSLVRVGQGLLLAALAAAENWLVLDHDPNWHAHRSEPVLTFDGTEPLL